MTNTHNGSKTCHLYGFPVDPNNTEVALFIQVADILREEIVSGRWSIGERLPSKSQLAHEAGISTFPVQGALDMLSKEGYLRLEQRKGSFLKALHVGGAKPKGVIGIVLPAEESMQTSGVTVRSETFDRWHLDAILRALSERDYAAEVAKYSSQAEFPGQPPNSPPRNTLFRQSLQGIISFCPFDDTHSGNGKTPVIYLGLHGEDHLPSMSGDNRLGLYKITKQIVEAGHRHIQVWAEPSMNAAHVNHALQGTCASDAGSWNQPQIRFL